MAGPVRTPDVPDGRHVVGPLEAGGFPLDLHARRRCQEVREAVDAYPVRGQLARRPPRPGHMDGLVAKTLELLAYAAIEIALDVLERREQEPHRRPIIELPKTTRSRGQDPGIHFRREPRDFGCPLAL